eukprot:s381_g25.t1
MFRGPGANPLRTQTFDRPQAARVVITTESHILSLRIVALYKHLGARFAMDADIDQEISARVASASQAFEEMKRPIFLNRAIAIPGRQQLYHSLVASRLLYGCAVWSDVSGVQLQRLEGLLLGHHRRIHNIGFWTQDHVTDDEFRIHSQMIPFRILWARNRLIYLQSLSKFGLDFHKDLLLLDFAGQRGWLWEVCEDLRWLLDVIDIDITVPTCADDWRALWLHLAALPRWKSTVQRACRNHLLQEKIAWKVSHHHDAILHCLRAHGCSVDVGEVTSSADHTPQFVCRQCDKSFLTEQALASHAYQKHGILSDESPYIQSTTCPGCLRDFHSTYRVLHHLKYRRNGCFDRLHGARLPDHPEHIALAPHLRGVKRLPAIRRMHGPLRPTSVQRYRTGLRERIARLRLQGADEYAWWWPSQDPQLAAAVCSALTTCLHEWSEAPQPNELLYHNMMFAVLFSFHIPDLQAARLYIHWVETEFYHAWPSDIDPDLALLLDKANLTLLEDLPTWRTRHEMARLTQLWANLPADEPEFPPLPLPVTRRPYDRTHPIRRGYAEMATLEAQRCLWKLVKPTVPRALATIGPFYVIHLYSGGRREGDFHDWMLTLLQGINATAVRVLSIDTAIHPSFNIYDQHLWEFLHRIIVERRCLGLLMGPPCETWSAARHQRCVDENGMDTGGPRPLRHGDCLWGLEKLCWRELNQLFVGSDLLLQGLFLACCAALNGSPTFVEHPAPPFDSELASIWRLGLLRLLMRFPEALFRRTTIQQWRFGSPGIKPTTLMYSNADLPSALEQCVIPGLTKPTAHLIGKDSAGQFRTAVAKQYPASLNKSFAVAIVAKVSRHQYTDSCDSLVEPFGHYLSEVAACAEHGICLPDYQPV